MENNNPDDDKLLSVEALEAKAIYLVDDAGATRASLACGTGERRGRIVVQLYDGDGRPRLTLQVDDDEGASISLWNQTNSPCVSLGVLNERGNGITICDTQGRPKIIAGTTRLGMDGIEKSITEISVINSKDEEIWSVHD
jgi:hypothetical protein